MSLLRAQICFRVSRPSPIPRKNPHFFWLACLVELAVENSLLLLCLWGWSTIMSLLRTSTSPYSIICKDLPIFLKLWCMCCCELVLACWLYVCCTLSSLVYIFIWKQSNISLPTPNINIQSPYTVLHTDHNPLHLHSFGYLCFLWQRLYTVDKLQPKSIPCIFIGYSPSQYAYNCLDPLKSKIYTSRHVIFDDNHYYYHSSLN